MRVRRDRLEALFVERLRSLQPRPEYLRLFRAIVQDVWRQEQAEARKARDESQRALKLNAAQMEQLEAAFIFERRIDQTAYDRQRDRLAEEATLLRMRIQESSLEELDVEGLLAFAEHVIGDAARMWTEASLQQRAQLQRVFFPNGLDFDGCVFGTATTCLAFSDLQPKPASENGVASPTGRARVVRGRFRRAA